MGEALDRDQHPSPLQLNRMRHNDSEGIFNC